MRNTGWHRLAGAVFAMVLGTQGTHAADPLQWFDVLDLSVQRLNALPETPDQPFEVEIFLDGQVHTFLIGQWNLRAEHAKAYTIGVDGIRTPYQPGPALTVRGASLQDPSLVIAGSLLADGLKVIVTRMDGEGVIWGIQPLAEADPASDRSLHVVYRGDDSLATGQCGNAMHDHQPGDAHDRAHDHAQNEAPDQGFGVFQNRYILEAQIAHDADYQYFLLNASSEANTINDIDNVMAANNLIYERDTSITFITTGYVIRTSAASDPYQTNNPFDLINEFQAHWAAQHQDIPHDLAHLWTGRDFGFIIGIAFAIGDVCTDSSYCISRSKYTENFNSRVALTAHEIGHLFGAWHCNQSPYVSNPCNVMCSSIGGCSGLGLPNFSPQSKDFITTFAESLGCLGVLPIDLPIVDGFDVTTQLDRQIWREITNTPVISSAGILEPSPGQSLRLGMVNGQPQSVTTHSFVVENADPIHVGLWAQARGLNRQDALIVEYFDEPAGQFVELFRFQAENNNLFEELYTYKVAALPQSVVGTTTAIRIRNIPGVFVTGGGWFVDSLRIGDVPLHGLPFSSSGTGTTLSRAHWILPSGALPTAEGMRLTAGRTLVSIPMRGDYFAAAGLPLYLSFDVLQDNPAAGMDLVAEVRNGTSVVELARVPAGGPGTGAASKVQVQIPSGLQVSGMQIRFRTAGSLSSGGYLIRNVLVGNALPGQCLGDIADDFGFTASEGGGPDGVVDFGDFVALLGLIGSCPGGTPGCLGDIADDFGFTVDEGGGPDGVVDFGDFVALLGLIGPCP